MEEMKELKERKEEIFDITQYRVVYAGLNPRTSDQTKQELIQKTAVILAISAAKAKEMVEGRNVVLKSNLEAEEAHNFVQPLKDIGLEISVTTDEQPEPVTKSAPAAVPQVRALPDDPVILTCLSCGVRHRARVAALLPQEKCVVCGNLVAPAAKFPAIQECRHCHGKNRVKTPEQLPQAKCAKCNKRLLA